MCVCVCVQAIAECRSELSLPTTSGKDRAWLEKQVQGYENHIRVNEQNIAKYDEEIVRITA